MINKEIKEFLRESNAIEREYSDVAMSDAVLAWKYAYNHKDEISVPYILGIHARLMKHLNPRIAGKFRDCDVWIGGQRHVFISQSLLKDELQNVITTMNNSFGLDLTVEEKEKIVKDCHVMFEDAHIFSDGNGRVGRAIYNIHRLKLGLPIHIIHADWPDEDGEQSHYYSWFR